MLCIKAHVLIDLGFFVCLKKGFVLNVIKSSLIQMFYLRPIILVVSRIVVSCKSQVIIFFGILI